MKRSKKRNNLLSDLQEKAISWFWVIIFISAIMFLRVLLVEMHVETTRLSEEQQRFKMDMKEERKESEELYKEFYAQLNESIQAAIDALSKGKIPSNNFNSPTDFGW